MADDQSASTPEDKDANPAAEDAASAGTGPDSDATEPMAASELDDDRAPDPDATKLIRPADPDATQAVTPSDPKAGSTADDGATQLMKPGGGDATESKTADDGATELIKPADDATTVLPQGPIDPAAPPTTVLRPQVPDATSVMPPASDAARWSAKANVPRSVPRDPDATAQWEPPEPGRAWWLPILLAVIALLVLLGVVYFLITSLNNNDQPSSPTTPAPTQSVAPSSVAPTTPPTSAPPTSAAPTQPGAPYVITSALIGLPINEAEAILDDNQVAHTSVAQPDDTHFPNTVVQISPDVGQTVPPGGTVTLYYAKPTVTTPTTPGTSTPSPSVSPGG